MIKAFLFDYGGVITNGGRGVEVPARLAANLHITPNQALELLKPIWPDYSRGKLSESEFWDLIAAGHGHSIDPTKRNIWNRWENMKPFPEMIQLVRDLKKDGYPVGLLSNIVPNTEHEIRTNGGYDDFDFLVLSCKAGYCKPDIEIYNLALEQFEDIKPSDIVFLDDQERYLTPAKTLGLKTILVTDYPQAVNDVEDLLKSNV